MSGSQKFIARNRAPRVQIEYDVEVYGSEKKVQLPFVMGVMSDLSGRPEVALPPVADRKFLEIDVDTFDDRMKAMRPRVAFNVPNTLTGEGNLAVDIVFERMDDFSPAAIAAKVEPLRQLFDARTQLANLMTYMDGKAGAEALLERILADRDHLATLALAASDTADADAALAALRAAAPVEAAPVKDEAADALAALRAVVPIEAAPLKDEAADALAALRAVAPVEAPAVQDEAADALAVLRSVVPVEAAPVRDEAADALAALRTVAPVEAAPVKDEAADALAALRSVAPVEAPAVQDEAADALAALRAVVPVETAPVTDEAADALAALRAGAPVEAPAVKDEAADALAALRSVAPGEAVPVKDEAADALAALRAVAPVEAVPVRDEAANALAALRTVAPVEAAPVKDEAADALAALRSVAPVEAPAVQDEAADALAALRTVAPVEAPAVQDEAADALAALRAVVPVEAAPVTDEAADALAALRSVAPVEAPAVKDEAADALAALRSIAPVETTPVKDEAVDALSALLAAVPGTTPSGKDDASDVLSSLRAAAPVEGAAEVDEAAVALAALRSQAPAPPPVQEDAADASAALLAAVPHAAAPTPSAYPLDDLSSLLAPPAPTVADALDDLSSLLAPLAPAAADPLDDLSSLLDPPAPAAADPLDDLSSLLAAPAPAAADPLDDLSSLLDAPAPAAADPLDDLSSLLAPPAPAAADPLDDLSSLLAPPALAAADPLDDLSSLLDPPAPAAADPLDDLSSLLAPPAPAADPLDDLSSLLDAPAPAADPLDDLAALLAAPAPTPVAVDPLDDLDAMLAGVGGPAAPQKEKTMAPSDSSRSGPASSSGVLTASAPRAENLARKQFRIAILGDFSGRAAGRAVQVGAALADRRATRLDVDTVEDVIERFATRLVLPIGPEGKGIAVKLRGLDDLHPDELAENVELFDELNGLRQRLSSPSLAQKAVAEMQGWGAKFTVPAAPTSSRSGAASVPADRRLSDFQQLIGDGAQRLSAPSPAADLIARIMGPYVVPGTTPEAKALKASVDDAMSAAMRLVLHHPEFQAIEAQWRSLDLLARQIETDEKLEVIIFDISAEEFAADLGGAADLSQSGVFRILNEPLTADGGVGYSAVFGLYTFEETPPHAELLGRMGKIAAHIQAPFVAAMAPGFIEVPKRERHPLVARAWDGLRAEPEAAWLGLAAPRFLLRRPYGARSEPIDAFDFEEFTMSEGLSGMLWCNPAVLVAILLARAWTEDGPKMAMGKTMSIGQMPYHIVTDRHGDQIALPCTERNVSTEVAETIVQRGFMPVVSVRGRDVVRLGAFQSLAGTELAGPWSGNPPPARAPSDAGRMPTIAATHAPPPAAASVDDELDALLAGFGTSPAPADPAAIDADLAALLEGL